MSSLRVLSLSFCLKSPPPLVGGGGGVGVSGRFANRPYRITPTLPSPIKGEEKEVSSCEKVYDPLPGPKALRKLSYTV